MAWEQKEANEQVVKSWPKWQAYAEGLTKYHELCEEVARKKSALEYAERTLHDQHKLVSQLFGELMEVARLPVRPLSSLRGVDFDEQR